jgi:hypothetical protein
MKPTDNASALVTPFLGLIHGLKNGIARTGFGAEKRSFGDTDQIQAADGPKSDRDVFT